MNRLLLSLALLFAGAVSAQDWQLVWSDEFDGAGAPDPAKWTYDIGGGGWGNQESQFYTDRTDNARQENGSLVIEAKEEDFGGREYTSARLVTRGLASWKYGRIEARIRLPQGQGIWPAFWMLAEDSPYGGWPTSGEIDIMEYLGHDTDRVYGTLHYGGGEIGHRFTGTHYDLPTGDFPDDYHTFSIEWEPRRIRWFVDGQLYQTQVSWTSAAASYPAPFDQPFHLLLNVAVGGEWPGYPDATTVFPQQMLVDYVRVYQDADAYPQVSLIAPDVLPEGGTLALSATATDGGQVTRVEFLQGGGVIGVDTEAPYEWTVEGAVSGCYQLSARATDDAGYVTETDPTALTVGDGCPAGSVAPFLVAPASVPGTVEAEHYDLGGADVAYRDLGEDNTGSGIRQSEGVDIDASRDQGGGDEVTDIVAREWLTYTLDIEEAGSYRVFGRIASSTGGTIRASLDGEDLFGDVTLAPTGGLLSYGNAVFGITDLPAGRHVFRIDMRSAGFVLNKFVFTRLGATPTEAGADDLGLHLRVSPNPASGVATVRYRLAEPGPVDLALFDAVGRRVRLLASELKSAGEHVASADLAGLAPGTYAAVLTAPGGRRIQRVAVVR